MRQRLSAILSALLLIGTSPTAGLAAFPIPGDNPHERYILPFRSNDYPIRSCKNYLFFDNERLKEILARRIGADIADGNYPKAIARLDRLLKAVEVLPSAQARSDFLINIFNPYVYRDFVYDGALVRDLEVSTYLDQPKDALVELLVRQSLVNPNLQVQALLDKIEALNQPLGSAYGVPKAITFVRLSRQFSLLAQSNLPHKERFHQRALAQLKAASSTIALIQDTPIRINMLILLGRRYAAIGQMATAKMVLEQSIQLLQQTKISNTRQAEYLSGLLGSFQTQLGQFEAVIATNGINIELIAAMLKTRSPQSVLSLVQTTNSEAKAQELGAVAIAFAQQGNSTQGLKVLEQAISVVPLDENPQDIYRPWFLKNASPPKKTAIRLDLVFPLVANYAKTGQTGAALEIAQGTQSKVLMMAIKAVVANEYAKTRDPRAINMMSEGNYSGCGMRGWGLPENKAISAFKILRSCLRKVDR